MSPFHISSCIRILLFLIPEYLRTLATDGIKTLGLVNIHIPHSGSLDPIHLM